MDARFVSADPPGPVKPGQTIRLSAPAFGRSSPVAIKVRDVDPRHRWIDLLVRLPFGIDNHERVTLAQTEPSGTLVGINRDFHLPPGWRGRLVAVFLGRELRRGPEESLRDLIRAAETL